MSYTVLARRYRSTTFDEVIGQEHVAQTLKKAIEANRIAHAFLFNGTRGVGKTSMARIMAKALNCRAGDGPTANPCGKCDSCLAVPRGEDMDVIEIDAASNTGVDDVRQIIENSQYRPARSRFKIYIIDEVHMLSKNAFNALLKTLEEPPSHVKFILATTEPEKVPATILSRCQRYDFRNIPTREIAGHLKDICKKEKIKADDDALLLVARAGAGSMRDSLSLLDRLLSIGEKHLTVEMIEQLLGLPRAQLVFDLADAIGNSDVKETLTRANAMVQAGLSVDGLIVALTDHLRNLLVLRTCGSDSDLVEVAGLAAADLAAQADRFDPAALTQDIVILEELRRHARQSQAGRALLDATLVRMALADQFSSIGELLGRLDGGGGNPSAAPRPRPQPQVKSAPPVVEKKKVSEEEGKADGRTQTAEAVEGADLNIGVASALDQIDVGEDDDLPRPGKVWEGPGAQGESLSALLRKQAAAAESAGRPAAVASSSAAAMANVESVDPDHLPGIWQAVLSLLGTKGPSLPSLLANGQFVGIEDGRAVIRYGAQHGFFIRQLERNGKKEIVRDALAQVMKQTIGIKLEIAAEEEGGATLPAEAPSTAAPDRPVIPAPMPRRAPNGPPPPASEPATPSIRITPELVQSLRDSEPLIAAAIDGLGAQVIRVE